MAQYEREATTSSTGSSNAARINVSQGRTTASLGWDVSGSASISVEVSHDGSTWFDRTHDVITSQPGSSETKAETFQTGFQHIRVYVDQNINTLAISAKGN